MENLLWAVIVLLAVAALLYVAATPDMPNGRIFVLCIAAVFLPVLGPIIAFVVVTRHRREVDRRQAAVDSVPGYVREVDRD